MLGQLISNVEARLGQTISIMISEVEERLMERMQDKFTQINARLDTLGQLISNVEARLNGTDAGHADQDSSRTLDFQHGMRGSPRVKPASPSPPARIPPGQRRPRHGIAGLSRAGPSVRPSCERPEVHTV